MQQRRVGTQRPLRREPTLDQLGTADRADLFAEQHIRVHARWQRKVVAPNCEIDSVVERKRTAPGDQMHLRLGMRLRQLAQKHRPARQQPAHQQRGLAGQRQALLACHTLAQAIAGAAHALHAFLHGLGQLAARVGQEHTPTAALEQREAQVVFQRAHRTADRTMRQVQFFRRPPKMLQPRGRLKAAQCIQRGHALRRSGRIDR